MLSDNKNLLSTRRALLGGGVAAMVIGAVPGRACACGSDHPPIALDGVQMDFRARRGSVCWRYLCGVTPIIGTKTALPSPAAVDLEGRRIRVEGYVIPHAAGFVLAAFNRPRMQDVPGGVAALIELQFQGPVTASNGIQTVEGVFEVVPNLGDGAQLQPIYRLTQAKTDPMCRQYGPLPRSI